MFLETPCMCETWIAIHQRMNIQKTVLEILPW